MRIPVVFDYTERLLYHSTSFEGVITLQLHMLVAALPESSVPSDRYLYFF